MAKSKKPILSFKAQGGLGDAIAMRHSRRQSIVEKKPIPTDVKSLAQLSWRHMYQKAVALWHALSAAEQQEWESSARPKHMTGFAWFMSQALKPNPGLYLPLQGGTMAGNIDMAKHRLLQLPLPIDSQEALTLAYYTANIAPYLYNEGAKVWHNASQSIPNTTWTILAFNSEIWDTDTIHSNTVNNSRLTCKTAGKYLVWMGITITTTAAGKSIFDRFLKNGAAAGTTGADTCALWETPRENAIVEDLDVGDFMQLDMYHNVGIAVPVPSLAGLRPWFSMQRIAP